MLALALTLASIAISQAEDTGYRVKAVVVRSAGKRMEGQFVVVPKDLRIVCEGDTTGISEGDYVKLEFKNGEFTAGKMVCDRMAWYH